MHTPILTVIFGIVVAAIISFVSLSIKAFGIGIFALLVMAFLVIAGFWFFSPVKTSKVMARSIVTVFILALVIIGLRITVGDDLASAIKRWSMAGRHELATELDQRLPIMHVWKNDPYYTGSSGNLFVAKKEIAVKPTGAWKEYSGGIVLREVLVGSGNPPSFFGAERIWVEPDYLHTGSSQEKICRITIYLPAIPVGNGKFLARFELLPGKWFIEPFGSRIMIDGKEFAVAGKEGIVVKNTAIDVTVFSRSRPIKVTPS